MIIVTLLGNHLRKYLLNHLVHPISAAVQYLQLLELACPAPFPLPSFFALQDTTVQYVKYLLVMKQPNNHPKNKISTFTSVPFCHLECRIVVYNC